jgi:hypothetical protein
MITKRQIKKGERYCPWHGFHIYWLKYQHGFGETRNELYICGPCRQYYEQELQSVSPTVLTKKFKVDYK